MLNKPGVFVSLIVSQEVYLNWLIAGSETNIVVAVFHLIAHCSASKSLLKAVNVIGTSTSTILMVVRNGKSMLHLTNSAEEPVKE